MNASNKTPRWAATALVVALGAAAAAGAAIAQSSTPTPTDPVPAAGAQVAPGGMQGMPGHGGMRHGMKHGDKAGHGEHAGMHGGRGEHAQRGRPGGGEAMMQRLDTDGDGQLSRAEVEAGHQAALARRLSAFDAADSDRDGKLSAQERQAMRESMRAQYGGERMGGKGHRHGGATPQGGGAGAPAAPAVVQPNS